MIVIRICFSVFVKLKLPFYCTFIQTSTLHATGNAVLSSCAVKEDDTHQAEQRELQSRCAATPSLSPFMLSMCYTAISNRNFWEGLVLLLISPAGVVVSFGSPCLLNKASIKRKRASSRKGPWSCVVKKKKKKKKIWYHNHLKSIKYHYAAEKERNKTEARGKQGFYWSLFFCNASLQNVGIFKNNFIH